MTTLTNQITITIFTLLYTRTNKDQAKIVSVSDFQSCNTFLQSLANKKLSGFAEACYDNNTLDDLIADLGNIDATSQRDWNLTDEEYHLAILTVIAHHKFN